MAEFMVPPTFACIKRMEKTITIAARTLRALLPGG